MTSACSRCWLFAGCADAASTATNANSHPRHPRHPPCGNPHSTVDAVFGIIAFLVARDLSGCCRSIPMRSMQHAASAAAVAATHGEVACLERSRSRTQHDIKLMTRFTLIKMERNRLSRSSVLCTSYQPPDAARLSCCTAHHQGDWPWCVQQISGLSDTHGCAQPYAARKGPAALSGSWCYCCLGVHASTRARLHNDGV